MKRCKTCRHWQQRWDNEFEGECLARVEITDSQFVCEDYQEGKDGKDAKAR